MTGPSTFRFVRIRAGLSWLILITATLVSFAVGAEHGTGAAVVVVVVAIAAVKIRLVGLDVMELRCAPFPLRALFEAYCVLLWAVLSGFLSINAVWLGFVSELARRRCCGSVCRCDGQWLEIAARPQTATTGPAI